MPGVKKLFQESENSAKPTYIHGHMFGGLGILAGSVRSWACIPLGIRLHDGLQAAIGGGKRHLSQPPPMWCRWWRTLTVPALEKLKALNGSGKVRMEIATKAKKSYTAFQSPAPVGPERDDRPKRGLRSI